MTVTEAIRLIATRAPSVQHEAFKSLHATGANQQRRLNWLIEQGLRDPEAAWTAEERAALVALIAPVERETRTERLYIRLTETESADLQERADAETNGDRSEYVRRRVFGS